MEAWAWLAAYLVGFALLQLALYRYFQRGESTEAEREPGYKRLEQSAGRSDIGIEDRDGDADHAAETTAVDDDAVVCQQCGAVNEREGMFSYCRECAGALR